MRVQDWIFTVRYWNEGRGRDRWAVIGPARASTVEAALHLAEVPEAARAEIRTCQVVRDFVDGRLDPESSGYYTHALPLTWTVSIGSVQEVLPR